MIIYMVLAVWYNKLKGGDSISQFCVCQCYVVDSFLFDLFQHIPFIDLFKNNNYDIT